MLNKYTKIGLFWTLSMILLIQMPNVLGQTNTNTNTNDNSSNNSSTNTNTNNINNASSAGSNSQIAQQNYSVNTVPGVVGSPVPNAPPSVYGTAPCNSPWNFIPSHILFHPSKTIGDNSPFSKCRLVKASTPLKSSFKDKLLGVFDERKFVPSGIGYLGNMSAGAIASTGSMVVCGLNTNLPPKCVKFVGSGSVFMENYATSEGALVGLAQMGAQYGANLVGNVKCAYSETVQSYGLSLGSGANITDSLGGSSVGSAALGGVWSTGITKKPVQPYCFGDFFVATVSECIGKKMEFAPEPRLYRRYLAPSQQARMPRYTPPVAVAPVSQPVRGYW